MAAVAPSLLLSWARARPSPMTHFAHVESGLTILTLIASKNDYRAYVALLARVDSATHRAALVAQADAFGNTAMHYFALAGNRAALAQLADLGGSFTARNNADETPYDVCLNGSLRCV